MSRSASPVHLSLSASARECVSGSVGQKTLVDLTSKPSFFFLSSPSGDFVEWEGQNFSLTFHDIVMRSGFLLGLLTTETQPLSSCS